MIRTLTANNNFTEVTFSLLTLSIFTKVKDDNASSASDKHKGKHHTGQRLRLRPWTLLLCMVT